MPEHAQRAQLRVTSAHVGDLSPSSNQSATWGSIRSAQSWRTEAADGLLVGGEQVVDAGRVERLERRTGAGAWCSSGGLLGQPAADVVVVLAQPRRRRVAGDGGVRERDGVAHLRRRGRRPRRRWAPARAARPARSRPRSYRPCRPGRRPRSAASVQASTVSTARASLERRRRARPGARPGRRSSRIAGRRPAPGSPRTCGQPLGTGRHCRSTTARGPVLGSDSVWYGAMDGCRLPMATWSFARRKVGRCLVGERGEQARKEVDLEAADL